MNKEIFTHYCDEKIRTKLNPLNDEEILNSWVGIDLPEECWITDEQLINFARAIEKRHGIK
jgi:hypothetical protein